MGDYSSDIVVHRLDEIIKLLKEILRLMRNG